MIYTLDYFEKMLKLNAKTGELISKIRWDFVSEINPKVVLDYGSGCGFFRAWRPDITVDTFDIGNFPQTGILHDKYDLVCFWDVLEHIPNFAEIEPVLLKTEYVALTVPVLPKGQKLETWKHFKPGEHLHYFTEKMISQFFKKYNFELLKKGGPECPPRTDVLSFLYGRSQSLTLGHSLKTKKRGKKK